jgi:hypothetical protein
MTAEWRKLRVINFSKSVARMQPGAGKQLSAFSDVACRRSFGPGEPATVTSDRQTRLSGRKRGFRPLERSVVGDYRIF